MATHILTPNTANQYSGLTNPILGWQFTAATALDVFDGCNLIRQSGWSWQITPDPANDALWTMQIAKGGYAPLTVADTQWFVFDGYFVRVLDQADVEANYTVTTR